MNNKFNSKVNNLRQNDPSKEVDESNYKRFESIGNVRNICFKWPDGNMKFLNYAYLITGNYSTEEDKITLVFTSETVVLIGLRLDILFNDLLLQLPMEISSTDRRYNSLNTDNFLINDIVIKIS